MEEFKSNAVGETIKKLRKKRNLSQEVLSGLAGLGRSHLAMIESGRKKANFETVWKLSYALGMCPHELVRSIEKHISETKQK